MSTIADAARTITANIENACRRSNRRPEDVTLVAVTKFVPVPVVQEAAAAGLHDFGENYAAELTEKASVIRARWHFVGTLQASNVARITDHADVIHSAVPGAVLERTARRASRVGKVIPCLIQVDFTGRRHGVGPEEVTAAVRAARSLEGIHVVGLMTLPPLEPDPESARPYFARLRELRDGLGSDWAELRELSMGMSADYQVAVEEGATMWRIGTALFGDRQRKRTPESAGRGSQGSKET